MRFFKRQPAPLSAATPTAAGHSTQGRDLLERAARKAEAVSENRDRTAKQTQAVLADLGKAAEILHDAQDPEEARAFYLLASRLRYEKDQGERTLALFDRSLTLDPSSTDAWMEYLNYITYIPDPHVLVADYHRMRPPARNACLSLLLGVARGYDRWGRLPEADRAPFQAAMSAAVEAVGDRVDVAFWFGDLGMREEKNGSIEQAMSWMATAASTGHARPQVVDRMSTLLLKSGSADAAAEALDAIDLALSSPIDSAALRDRLAKRKARCEKVLASRDG
jgi:tetratricopeptide (TPR) repeat protein